VTLTKTNLSAVRTFSPLGVKFKLKKNLMWTRIMDVISTVENGLLIVFVECYDCDRSNNCT
jgi:hypothetical protein